MAKFKYVIIGGGMTADSAVRGIREVDPQGTIALFTSETYPPYNRPPLSKKLWKGKPLDSIWRNTESLNVVMFLGRTITAIDVNGKTITDDHGQTHTYEKLLLATGGTPRRLPFGGEAVNYFRTLDDYKQLRLWTEKGSKFAVIGGGFIGSEVAAALAMNGRQVVEVFPEEGIAARIFPTDILEYINKYYQDKGVQVMPKHNVTGIDPQGSAFVVHAQDMAGKTVEIPVDGIVAGLGIIPNTQLAEAVGIQVQNGILVDETLQTNSLDIYAAGDVANFEDKVLQVRRRVEHEDNADMMGLTAGQNMAGKATPYHYLPYFYSDMFDIGYEAVGELDARLQVVADWVEPYKKGVLYYLKDNRVRGVLLWNTWGKVDAARKLIQKAEAVDAESLKEKIR
jgi:3-phenylpropionate/trans-cinnamate dioxygenase ferredoxin reductase component